MGLATGMSAGVVLRVAAVDAADFPSVSDLVETNISVGTSMPVDLPAVVDAGDLLIIIATWRSNASVSATVPSGWTELDNTLNNPCGGATWVLDAVGDEDGGTATFTLSGSRRATAHCYRIAAATWFGTISGGVETGTVSTATNSTVDPGALTPSWGSTKTLWLAAMHSADDDEPFTATPTNYTNLTSTIAGAGGNNSASTGTARRELEASSEDPGSSEIGATQAWVATTVGIRPA